MNKVDCVSEIMEECYQKGFQIGFKEGFKEGREIAKREISIELGIKLLEYGFPIDQLAEIIEIPVDKLEDEYEKYMLKSK